MRLYIGQQVTLAGHKGRVASIEGNVVTLRKLQETVRVHLDPAPVKVRRPKGESDGE